MNLTTETAVAAWLSSLTAFDGVLIHHGQSAEEIPNDETFILVACDNASTTAKSLFIARVRIIVSSPCVIDDSLTTHRTLSTALRSALNDIATLAGFFDDSVHCAGASLDRWNDTQSDQTWLTEALLSIGLVDTAATPI